MIWGGYPRISEDPHDLRAGITRQIDDITAAVKARGDDPERIQWFTENDTSAYKKRKVRTTDPLGNEYDAYRVIRPIWHGALHALRTGAIGGIMVWDLDRLARDPRDLEDAIEAVQYYGGRVEGSVPGSIDLTSDSGIAMARVLVAMNSKSSADTSRRVKRTHLDNAMRGKPVGGYRPFGWKADKTTLDPRESAIARQVVDDVLAGTPLREVSRGLNERGIATTAGKEWQHQTLRQYLKNPRLVGYRTHHREVLLDASGRPVQGLWEPLLDESTWARLQALLGAPERRVRLPRRGARHYLLTGLLRCGSCGGPMYGNRAGSARAQTYNCEKGHLGITMRLVDGLIRDLVLARLEKEELEGVEVEWPGEAELAALQAEKDELMAAYDSRQLSAAVVFPRVEQKELEIAEMQKSRVQWLTIATGPAPGSVTRDEWDGWTVDAQRLLVERVLDAVLIRPRSGPRNVFDPERVEPVWRRHPGDPAE